MSKAEERLYAEWKKECPGVSAVDFTLAKIRARRDVVGEYGDCPAAKIEFWSLFNDGAEFGPDKPKSGIEFALVEGGYFAVYEDGYRSDLIRGDTFEAIKKLGAEEARDAQAE